MSNWYWHWFSCPQLAEAHQTLLRDNNYPQCYCDLINPKVMSDDEIYSTGCMVKIGRAQSNVYLIKKRPERSLAFEQWIRILDQKRMEDTLRDPSKKWWEQYHEVPQNQQYSEFLALPEGMPIDYFTPDYYNSLQPCLRSWITNTKVAPLPDISQSFMRKNDKHLSD